MEEWGAMTVFGFGGGAGRAPAGQLEHLGVVVLPLAALGVPRCEVGDRHPGAHAGPELGGAGGHDEGHVAAAGTADEIDAISINAGVCLGVFNCIDDILRGQVGGAGFGAVVNPPESGCDHHPPALLGQSDKRWGLLDASAPAVQEDQEG